MKKPIYILLAFSMCVLLAACSSTEATPSKSEIKPTASKSETTAANSSHTHSYTSMITKNATCETTGIKKYTCSQCGDSYTETIPQTNHDYSSAITKNATCTEEGIRTYTCSQCGNSYTVAIPQTDHSYTAATCTEPKTCSQCGTTDEDPLGHTDGTTCSRCGTVTFQTMTFSGTNTGVAATGINLPSGRFKITLTYISARNSRGDWALIRLSDQEGRNRITNNRSLDSGESISSSFNGPLTDGYIETSGVYGGIWTVTIEAF